MSNPLLRKGDYCYCGHSEAVHNHYYHTDYNADVRYGRWCTVQCIFIDCGCAKTYGNPAEWLMTIK